MPSKEQRDASRKSYYSYITEHERYRTLQTVAAIKGISFRELIDRALDKTYANEIKTVKESRVVQELME